MRKLKEHFYQSRYVSEDVLKEYEIRYGKDTPKTYNPSRELRNKYIDLNISYFKTKEDFEETLREANVTKRNIDKYWNEYLKRNALIENGDYYSVRDSIMKKTYLEELAKSNFVGIDKYKSFIEGINPTEFVKLYESGNLLPIPEFYAHQNIEDQEDVSTLPEEMQERINRLIEEQEEEDYETQRKFVKYRSLEYYKLRNRYGKLYIKTTKTGRKYIPFAKREISDAILYSK